MDYFWISILPSLRMKALHFYYYNGKINKDKAVFSFFLETCPRYEAGVIQVRGTWVPQVVGIQQDPLLVAGTQTRPKQNGRRFADDVFKRISLVEKDHILTVISLKFVPKVPVDDNTVSIQVMAWRLTSAKPLPEPMLCKRTGACMCHWTPVGFTRAVPLNGNQRNHKCLCPGKLKCLDMYVYFRKMLATQIMQ